MGKTMDPAAVTAGASLAGTSVEQISQSMGTWRHVTIQISNRSETYILANPKVHTNNGYCFRPPQPTIEKNTIEVCSFSKMARVPRGCFGVMTYQILRNRKDCVAELAIMFSVPFAYKWFQNCFALGIYEAGTACDDALSYQMYYITGPFTKSRGTGSTLTYSGGDVIVKGTMSTGGRSVMKIEFWDA
ncbi:DELTA-actitoxin-Aeq1c-like [Colossoma macropomum]|uniref:DELTA-actitoxin-Aeq1c-like n=1 Tax=Colossoma macropomum TaxID=42526 RepID=UPI00186466A1|nr:DELTA-actitoxin-Aeq1c-like [Colossoma macropomum]